MSCCTTKIIQLTSSEGGGPYTTAFVAPNSCEITDTTSGNTFLVDFTKIDFSQLSTQQITELTNIIDFTQLTAQQCQDIFQCILDNATQAQFDALCAAFGSILTVSTGPDAVIANATSTADVECKENLHIYSPDNSVLITVVEGSAIVGLQVNSAAIAHIVPTNIDFKPTANPNEYTVEFTYNDEDGNPQIITDSTPVVIDFPSNSGTVETATAAFTTTNGVDVAIGETYVSFPDGTSWADDDTCVFVVDPEDLTGVVGLNSSGDTSPELSFSSPSGGINFGFSLTGTVPAGGSFISLQVGSASGLSDIFDGAADGFNTNDVSSAGGGGGNFTIPSAGTYFYRLIRTGSTNLNGSSNVSLSIPARNAEISPCDYISSVEDRVEALETTSFQSVTGEHVDNTDPLNPMVKTWIKEECYEDSSAFTFSNSAFSDEINATQLATLPIGAHQRWTAPSETRLDTLEVNGFNGSVVISWTTSTGESGSGSATFGANPQVIALGGIVLQTGDTIDFTLDSISAGQMQLGVEATATAGGWTSLVDMSGFANSSVWAANLVGANNFIDRLVRTYDDGSLYQIDETANTATLISAIDPTWTLTDCLSDEDETRIQELVSELDTDTFGTVVQATAAITTTNGVNVPIGAYYTEFPDGTTWANELSIENIDASNINGSAQDLSTNALSNLPDRVGWHFHNRNFTSTFTAGGALMNVTVDGVDVAAGVTSHVVPVGAQGFALRVGNGYQVMYQTVGGSTDPISTEAGNLIILGDDGEEYAMPEVNRECAYYTVDGNPNKFNNSDASPSVETITTDLTFDLVPTESYLGNTLTIQMFGGNSIPVQETYVLQIVGGSVNELRPISPITSGNLVWDISGIVFKSGVTYSCTILNSAGDGVRIDNIPSANNFLLNTSLSGGAIPVSIFNGTTIAYYTEITYSDGETSKTIYVEDGSIIPLETAPTGTKVSVSCLSDEDETIIQELIDASSTAGGVQSVTGFQVDNSDAANPVVNQQHEVVAMGGSTFDVSTYANLNGHTHLIAWNDSGVDQTVTGLNGNDIIVRPGEGLDIYDDEDGGWISHDNAPDSGRPGGHAGFSNNDGGGAGTLLTPDANQIGINDSGFTATFWAPFTARAGIKVGKTYRAYIHGTATAGSSGTLAVVETGDTTTRHGSISVDAATGNFSGEIWFTAVDGSALAFIVDTGTVNITAGQTFVTFEELD